MYLYVCIDVYCICTVFFDCNVEVLSIGVLNRVTDVICGPTPAAQGITSPMESLNLVFPLSLRRQIFSFTRSYITDHYRYDMYSDYSVLSFLAIL